MNYFAPHHGHSKLDAHFGVGKRILRRNARDGPIVDAQTITSSFNEIPQTAANFISVIESDVKVKPFKNKIRKWFQWKMENATIMCREQSKEDEKESWQEQIVSWELRKQEREEEEEEEEE